MNYSGGMGFKIQSQLMGIRRVGVELDYRLIYMDELCCFFSVVFDL